MTHTEHWFSSLTADERKKALHALHCYRRLIDTQHPKKAVEIATLMWPFVKGLLEALELDHEALKIPSL